MKQPTLLIISTFVLLSLFTAEHTLLAQDCEAEVYLKTIVSPGNRVRSRRIVNNDQFLFVSFHNEIYNFGITKTDFSSNPSWMKVYQPDGQFSFYDIIATQDGGVIRLGRDNDELGIIKLDVQGNIQWSKKYASPNWSGRANIIQKENGEFLVANAWDEPGSNPQSSLLMSLDTDGNILWTNYVERTSSNDFNRFVPVQTTPAPDGGYLITGKDLYTMMLMKVDENGNTIWLKRNSIGTINLSTNTEYLTVVNERQTGYYIFLYSYGTPNDRSHLLEIDLSGNVIKSKEIISDEFKGAGQVATLPSGNLVISGLPLANTDNSEAMVLLDTTFNVLASKAIGLANLFVGSRYNKNFVTVDENIYLIDNYQSGTDEGFYVQKASADLEVACQEEEKIWVTLEDLLVVQQNSSFFNYSVNMEVQDLSVEITNLETEEGTICEKTISTGAVYGSDLQVFCEGEPATVDGVTFSVDTILVNTYPTDGVCDSIHSTTLNFQAPQFTFEDLQVCDESTVVVLGQNISADTTLYGNFQTTYGCDSTHQINVIFGTNKFTDEHQQYCQGSTILIFGNPIGFTGSFTETYTAFDGCDSTHTIFAEFKNNLLTIDLLDYCEGDSTLIDGQIYSADTILFNYTTSYYGCDSTHRINLRFLENVEIPVKMIACQDDTLTIFGLSINQDTSLFRSAPAPNGCDSIWLVTVSFLDHLETSETITACNGDFITVFGNTVSQNTIESQTFTATNGCDSIHTIEVIFNPLVNTFETQTYCVGNIASIFGNSITSDTLLSETYTGSNNCDSTHQITVTFSSILQTSESITACEGDIMTVFGNAITEDGIFAETYASSLNCDSTHQVEVYFRPVTYEESIATYCAGETIKINDVEIFTDQDITFIETGFNGCDSIHTLSIQFVEQAVIEDTIYLCADAYVLFFEDTIRNSGTYSNFIPTLNSPCDTVYQLVVTQSDLTIPPLPDTIFAINGVIINFPLQIESNELTVTWNESEQLSCTICIDPVIYPQYDEWLAFVIRDNKGCAKTDQLYLSVDQPVAYYIPNAFSPNNDQINDRFVISANKKVQAINHLEIFNRWGVVVYQESNTAPNDSYQGWDGNFKGQAAPSGVYVYQVEILLADGTTILKAGDLSLFR